MNPGLKMGFVKFGTVAHRILVTIHEFGPQSNADLVEHLEVCAPAIASNIQRLRENKYIFRVDRRREYLRRSYSVFGLTPVPRQSIDYRCKRLTGNERSAAYRARKKKVVTSIFNYAGAL